MTRGAAILTIGVLAVGAAPARMTGGPPASPASLAKAALPVNQDTSAAHAFLSALRGTHPAVCELVRRALENRWGGGFQEPGLFHARPDNARVAELVRWATSDSRHSALPSLTSALRDSDACVRRVAAQLIGQRRDSAAVDVLLEALRSGQAETAEAGAVGLGYAESERAVDALIAALGTSAAPSVKPIAAWALGRTENDRAVPALVNALRDADPNLRLSAALALGHIEDRAAIPALSETLERDQDAGVRRAAAWALGNIE